MTKYEMILSVYHTHSISVTAEKYNYTQSAISQAIKSFEKELGLPLFKRTKNGMLPISNTEEIIRELRTICDAENRIADIASNLTSLKNGYIHIGTIKSIAYNWLPSMVRIFQKNIQIFILKYQWEVLRSFMISWIRMRWIVSLCPIICFRIIWNFIRWIRMN